MAVSARRLPKAPRSTILFIVVWNVVGISLFIGLAARRATWTVVIGLGASLVFSAMWIGRNRRRTLAEASSSGPATATPVTMAHATLPPIDASSVKYRWVGGGTFPTFLGKMEASYPLVVLEISTNALQLRVRPRILAGMFGIPRLLASPSTVDEIYFVSRRFRVGVAIVPEDSAIFSFWTPHADQVLGRLVSAGFAVSAEERRIGLSGRINKPGARRPTALARSRFDRWHSPDAAADVAESLRSVRHASVGELLVSVLPVEGGFQAVVEDHRGARVDQSQTYPTLDHAVNAAIRLTERLRNTPPGLT